VGRYWKELRQSTFSCTQVASRLLRMLPEQQDLLLWQAGGGGHPPGAPYGAGLVGTTCFVLFQ
jgi:hypothetical protein